MSPLLVRLRRLSISVPLLLIAPVALAGIAGKPPSSSEEDRPDVAHHVLTVSGGVSLGAYEAGYNWAFVRFLKQHRDGDKTHAPMDLLAVTGASAGNINAFLTAIAWCQRPQ